MEKNRLHIFSLLLSISNINIIESVVILKQDLSKQDLYTGVKTLVEAENKHIHLSQHKLFTLFSIGFQYLLFRSTKEPGAYIIRIEDSGLTEKLAKRAKDASTRKFLQSLLLPRKLKYGKSTFYLDFFHIGSWALTKSLEPDKIKGALIVKNTSSKPMTELMSTEEDDPETVQMLESLPKDYYLASLLEFVPKTLTIAFETDFEELVEVTFPFIKKEKEKIAGMTVSKEIDIDSFDS